MNLFEFLEEYIFVHFFDMTRLSEIAIPFRDGATMMGDDLLYILFALAAFVVGVWLVIWLPIKGIKWIAKGGRK